jgi:hypothetical protein
MSRSRTLLLALLLTACAKQTAPKAAAETAPAEAPAAEEAPVAETPASSTMNAEFLSRLPPEGTLVTLLDPGAEPRAPIRFQPEVGSLGKVRMTMTMDLTQDIAGNAMPKVAIPPILMDMAVDVLDVAEDGTVHFTADLVEVGLGDDPNTPDMMRELLMAQFDKMVGLRTESVITDTGRTVSSAVTFPEGMPEELRGQMDQMNQSLAQLAQPVPDEPVGVGARWETLSRMDNTLVIGQRTLYELVSRDGDLAVIQAVVTQSPIEDDVDLGGTPATITAFDSEGQGRSEWLPNSVMPSTARIDMKLVMTMLVAGVQELDQTMIMGMSMETID